MKCPVDSCHFHLFREWEAENPRSRNFTGVYRCPKHGVMRVSGRIGKTDDSKMIVHWHAACPEHGTDTVVTDRLHQIHTCMVCHRSMVLNENGKWIERDALPYRDRETERAPRNAAARA